MLQELYKAERLHLLGISRSGNILPENKPLIRKKNSSFKKDFTLPGLLSD